jgi:putative flavoprotein involved in K+ transport
VVVDTDALVIGGGQAGLATSYCLSRRGVPHVLLEQSRLASAWFDQRWDSFELITSNARTFTLPGLPYMGGDADGFASIAEIRDYFGRYSALVSAPVRLGVRAISVEPQPDGTFVVDTTDGAYHAANVVIATGLLQRARIPPYAAELPLDIVQIASFAYRKPAQLPAGNVLVVGSGQSGLPIAMELHAAGRTVYLALGSNGRAPGRYRGRPYYMWLLALGIVTFVETGVAKSRFVADASGRRDYNPHRLARDGMRLLGHVIGAKGSTVTLAPDLHELLHASDASERTFRGWVDDYVLAQQIDTPVEPAPEELTDGYAQPAIERLDLRDAGITSVIWCTGYDFDFGWVHAAVLDPAGHPLQERGVSPVPGLYFVGMQWRIRPATAFVGGVGEEAENVAADIAARAVHTS